MHSKNMEHIHCSKNSNPVCFIIPPALMKKILLEGTHEQKEKILYTYGLSNRIRGYKEDR